MPHYHTSGTKPQKRHTQFRKPDGGLYSEQLVSTEGLSNDYFLLYHCYPPKRIIKTEPGKDVIPQIAEEKMLQQRCFEGFSIKPGGGFLESRIPVLVNGDCHIVLAAPQSGISNYFYNNTDADAIIFVHGGSGTNNTQYGELPFSYGDYIVLPRGTIYQATFNDDKNRLFTVESFSPLRHPDRYLSKYGQLMEHVPYCERDIRPPYNLKTIDEKGDFLIKAKKQGIWYGLHYATHPFDAVGWDGCCHPYIFSIHNFESITGRVHQPPPVPQTFETNAFVFCSFVPRMYDYYPFSIRHLTTITM